MSWMDTLIAVALWPLKQLFAGARNLWTWLSAKLHPSEVILPWIWEMIVWLAEKIPDAAGAGAPNEQIEGAVVLGATVFVSTWWTGAGMIVALLLLGTGASIGLARMIPAINDAWTRYWPLYGMRIGLGGGA